MSHFDLVRTHRSTAVERARPRSLSPGVRERLLALGIDVGVFIITAPFLLGFCAVVLRDYWAAGAIAVVASYVVGSWALCSKTVGMSLARIQLVDERTGRCPGFVQVLLRTAFTVPSLVGVAVLLNEALTPGRAVGDVALALALAAALMGALSAAWGVLDSGRMLHDRLTGLVTVRTGSLDQVRRDVRR